MTTVGVVVVTHQSERFVGRALAALLAGPDHIDRIVVVDNGSIDGTGDAVARFAVEWLPQGANPGYAAAVAAGVARLDTEVIVVLNPDVVVRPGWLQPLVGALDLPEVGAAMPTIELLDRSGHHNTSGGAVAPSGLAWVTDVGVAIAPGGDPVTVPFPSGAAFAIRRAVWDRMGGMWADLFLYHEDTDLGWRLILDGRRTVRVPMSRVAHDYAFARTPEKLRLLERNRWMLLMTNYRRSTLVALIPVLLLHEAGVLWTALRGRWLGAKVGTWGEVVSRRRMLRDRRRSIQHRRTVGDAVVLRTFTGATAGIAIPGMTAPRGARLVDALSRFWVRVILPVVAALDRRRGLSV